MSDSACIVPIGNIDPWLVNRLAEMLNKIFKITFTVTDSMEIPSDAFNFRRNQHNSAKIGERLRKFKEDKVLGIIDNDLYARRLNFIFGQAESPGRCALISLTRLRPEFYGLGEDNMLFLGRVVKEAMHELGHTYGLGHCLNKGCVMFFSNSIIDTDRKGSWFCEICLKELGL